MTKFESKVVRIGCNMCDSPIIEWADKEDKNHLCKKCYDNDSIDWRDFT